MSTQDELHSAMASVTSTEVNSPARDARYQPAYQETAATSTRQSHSIGLMLANAETLLKHSERDSARALIYRVLAADSYHPLALKMAAKFLNPDRDLPQMLKIQVAICKSDYGYETVRDWAHLLYKSGQDAEALAKYHEALSLLMDHGPGLFEVYKNMGTILTREGDFDGAEEFFNRAFTLDPKSDILLVNLGTLSMQRQDFELALARFRQAVELNRQNDKAWVGLALVHQSMGDLALAIGNLESALDLNPTNRTAVHLLANWAIREGNRGLAVERLKDYLSRVEIDVDLSIVLIQAFCQMHRLELASLEVERVLLWEPAHPQLLQVEKEIRELLDRREHQTQDAS